MARIPRNSRSTRRQDGARKKSLLESVFSTSEELGSTFQSLNSTGEQTRLNFVSLADRHAEAAFSDEVARRLTIEVESGAIGGIGVVHRRVPLNIKSPGPIIDTAAFRKEASRYKKELGDVILRAVPLPILIDQVLGFDLGIVSLVLSRDQRSAPRIATPGASAALCLPPDYWTENASTENVKRSVHIFRKAPREMRRLAGIAMGRADPGRWAALRTEAIIQCKMIDLLAPAKKMLIANGEASDILKHALTDPEARAKRMGKAGRSRDELIHLIWMHTIATGQFLPPLVKL